MGSKLDQSRIITIETFLKNVPTTGMSDAWHDIWSKSKVNTLPLNRHNSLLCTISTFRQRMCNYRVGCLQTVWMLLSWDLLYSSGSTLSSTVPTFLIRKNIVSNWPSIE